MAAVAAAGVLVILLGLALGGVALFAGITGGGTGRGPGTPGVICAPPGTDPARLVPGFGPDQVSNAGQIITQGAQMGVPPRGIVTAVATAMQESALLNYANSTVPESLQLPHQAVGSDLDSVGVFQQRGDGWGDLATRMNPAAAAASFYRRLLQIPGWQTMSLTDAAQAVQVSAFPDAYTKWEQPAGALVGAFQGVSCPPGAGPGRAPAADPRIQQVIDRAMSQQGKPYVWGGGNADGPTSGGFDCSGLMVYAFAQLGITVPHQTQAIWSTFAPPITDQAALQPGDMLLFSADGSPGGIHHVGLYLGGDRMLDAPQSGDVVRVEAGIWSRPGYAREFLGGVRAAAAPPPLPASRSPWTG